MTKISNIVMEKKLIFKIGDDSQPTVMTNDEYKLSPFDEVIEIGVARVRELARYIPSTREGSSDVGYFYNIIPFLGERGSGKTSCLLTVRKCVETDEELKDKVHFFSIIDPSYFDHEHNILEIFIGKLYREYKKLEKEYFKEGADKRQKLHEFQDALREAKRALYFLNGKNQERPVDELDELSGLSDGVELSRIMRDLVKAYLNYMGKKKLIISIDDLDLNGTECYEMMEEIRLYLMFPELIILLAAKEEQLRVEISRVSGMHYDVEKNPFITTDEIEVATDRYLEKFIPLQHRIHMPHTEGYLKYKLEIWDSDGKLLEAFDTVAFAVVSLIFNRTRYLFYNHDGEANLIVPRNLRELCHLVTMLYKMRKPGVNKAIHNSNKAVFRQYFQEQWVATLTKAEQAFARLLLKETNPSKVNKLVVTSLLKIAGTLSLWNKQADTTDGLTERTRKIFKDIIHIANNPANVTIGDVAFVMKLIKEYEDSVDKRRLLFFVSTYYSMKLYEFYDEMTEQSMFDDNGFVYQTPTGATIPVLKNTSGTDLPDYFRLIGGSLFTLRGSDFVPLDHGVSRELTLIDGEALRREIDALIYEYDQHIKTGRSLDRLFGYKLRLVELFVLCLRSNFHGFAAQSEDPFVGAWRTNLSTGFFSSFEDARYLPFDVTAPFINMVYPRYAYDRVDKRFYQLAQQYDYSLLKIALSYRRRRKKESEKSKFYRDLMSRVAVRNMEVLEDLQAWLNKKTYIPCDSKDSSLIVLSQFYKSFSHSRDINESYSLKTYDRDERGTDFYTITYEPIGLLQMVLESAIINEDLKKYFKSIMNIANKLRWNQNYTMDDITELVAEISPKESKDILDAVREILGKRSYINSTQLIGALDKYPLLYKELAVSCMDEYLIDFYQKTMIRSREANVEIARVKENDAENKLSLLEERHKLAISNCDKLEETLNLHSDTRKKLYVSRLKLEAEGNRLRTTIEQLEQDARADSSALTDITEKIARLADNSWRTIEERKKLLDHREELSAKQSESSERIELARLKLAEISGQLEQTKVSENMQAEEYYQARKAYDTAKKKVSQLRVRINNAKEELLVIKSEVTMAKRNLRFVQLRFSKW